MGGRTSALIAAACALLSTAALAGPSWGQAASAPRPTPDNPDQPASNTAQGTVGEPAKSEASASEVVVTANRRDQNIQRYAGVAQVLSADQLKQANIGADITNLSQIVPGLNVANQEGNIELYIRGVGTSNNTELGDPSAAPLINGVYISRPRGLDGVFFDLAGVEVDKGPQGTLRGRNSTAGSINIETQKPILGKLGGFAEGEVGNYDGHKFEGALNIPIGDTLAFRFAAFEDKHSSYFDNAGYEKNLTPAGVVDQEAARVSALWRPNDRLSVFLMGDYFHDGGTGYPGANIFTATQAGYSPNNLNLRDVVFRGTQGQLRSQGLGIQADVTYDFGPFQFEYLGSRRHLHFQQTNAENDGIAYPGRVLSPYTPAAGGEDYDNYSDNYWLTDSQANVQELRLFAPKNSRFDWTAGLFYFSEDQISSLLSTADSGTFPNCCFSGTAYIEPNTQEHSYAPYADATFHVTDRFRIFGGLRYTYEEKSRVGVGGNFGLVSGSGAASNYNCCFDNRVGTPGFIPELTRLGFNPFDRSQAGQAAEVLAILGGHPGIYDTLQTQLQGIPQGGLGTCVNTPTTNPTGALTCPLGYSTVSAPSPFYGRYSDTFVDFRAGAEFDLAPGHLVYAKVSTGHKSGGFNDNAVVTSAAGVPTSLPATTYAPEKDVVYEIGSKNTFHLDGRYGLQAVRANVSGFFYDYTNQQFQSLVVTGGQAAQGGGGATVSYSLQNFNLASSNIYGLEFDTGADLPYGFRVDLAGLALHTEITRGQLADYRAQVYSDTFDPITGKTLAANSAPTINVKGNNLPNASNYTVNLTISNHFNIYGGQLSWQAGLQYRSQYYLSIFNSKPEAIGFSTCNFCTSAYQAGYGDKQDPFVVLNLGAQYRPIGAPWRLEGYIANVTNQDYSDKTILGNSLNIRFLNDPRTVGLRLHVDF